jgi:hypothetical protein
MCIAFVKVVVDMEQYNRDSYKFGMLQERFLIEYLTQPKKKKKLNENDQEKRNWRDFRRGKLSCKG